MKIRVTKPLIESILINLQPFLEKKDASQITSHIYFEAQNDLCTVKATDGEIGLVINSNNIIIEEEGSFTANGKNLLEYIRMLQDEITLEVIENDLIIKQNRTKYKLPTFNPSNFPTFPIIEDKPQISLDSINLIQGFKKISSAIDNNNPKFELNGALLDIKNSSTMLVGTDTRRLAISTMESENSFEFSLIIPKKAILEIQKLFMNKIDIFYDDTNLIIQNNNYYFFSRLINGNYPDYQRIIPSENKISIKLPKKEMIESIKKVTPVSQEIKLTFSANEIMFEALTADNKEAKDQLDLDTGLTTEFALNVNSRYLLDFITQVEESEFELLLNEPTLPFVLKDNNFITVIMPIIA
jgi:DNA polymerase-3 subunit beta